MSFILDALKKSETDRQRQSAPALFEVKVAAPRRRFPLWAIGLAALLGVNVLVLAWVLLRQPSSPSQAAASPAPATGLPANVVYVPAVMIPQPANGQVNGQAMAPVTVAPLEAGVVAPSVAPPLAEDPLLSSDEPSVPPDYDANDYAPAVTREEATASAQRRAGFLPSRNDVLAKGIQLPDLKLDLHVYAENPADRFVFINMRKLREGESLPEGVRVDAVTPSGADLSYRGTRFNLEGN
ncbi:MAG: general secretion pathway protein GspB [Steroidobacteraceae bacterium]|nr:general secretion pathway protein GspB [Steroidobacteraceae bacterium]